MFFVFFDVYLKWCEEFGFAPTTVLKTLGISKSAYSNWKIGGEPSNRTKKQIADYFGITVRELMEGQKETAPAEAETDNDEMAELLETIRRRPDLQILFSLSKKATPDDVRKTIQIIKTICGDDNGENIC